METMITATTLANNLSDVLDRVKERGERFVVEQNGERVATIIPSPPNAISPWASSARRCEQP